MSQHRGTAVALPYATRSPFQDRQHLKSARHLYFPQPSPKAFRPRSKRRCDGAFSDCISSIYAHSTAPKTTIIFRSRRVHSVWQTVTRAGRRPSHGWSGRCPNTHRCDHDTAAKTAKPRATCVAMALWQAIPAGYTVRTTRAALPGVDGRISHALFP